MDLPRILPACILLAAAFAGCAGGGGRADGDGDGLLDRTEEDGWWIEVTTMDRRYRYNQTSDPTLTDTDGDGVSDDVEFEEGTDPREGDTDGDGLSDCQELLHSVREACEDPAFNGPYDGGTGTDPRRADSDIGPSRYRFGMAFVDEIDPGSEAALFRGDGLSDGDEWRGVPITFRNGSTLLTFPDPGNVDTDEDGLEDAEEVLLFFTHPNVADTDGDGCTDGRDPRPDLKEHYDIGLQNFTLLRPLEDGGGNISVAMYLETTRVRAPEDGGIQVAPNETQDLTPFSPAPFRLDRCPHQVMPDPWLRLHVFAHHHGEASKRLDVSSVAGPVDEGGRATLYWNPWTGAVAQEATGTAIATPVTWTGADASVVIDPVVRDGSGQVV